MLSLFPWRELVQSSPSQVVFELWKNSATYYIRVLWGGQPLQTSTPLGTMDMVKLDDFNAYLNSTLPSDLVAACAAT